MTDDLPKRARADKRRIRVSEPWEVRYWARELGCTEDSLRDALQKADNTVEAIGAQLKGPCLR